MKGKWLNTGRTHFKKGVVGENHWANKSGNYLRITTDWIRLCVKCHRVYDYGMVPEN